MLRGSWMIVAVVMLVAACGKYEQENNYAPQLIFVNENSLYNSAFDLWQRGTSHEIPARKVAYMADRWYVSNQLGNEAVVSVDRTSAAATDSKYAARIRIKIAPQKASGELALYQTLDQTSSRIYYDRKASFSVHVQALGKVNRVGLQFFYATEESKVDQPIGEEKAFDVSMNEYRHLFLSGVDIGKGMGKKGVLGIRVRPLSTYQGSLHEPDNGIVVEQAMMNLGGTAGEYRPRFQTDAHEIQACQRFFEKSFDLDSPLDAVTNEGAYVFGMSDFNNKATLMSVNFKMIKRVKPRVVLSDFKGTRGKVRYDVSDGEPAEVDEKLAGTGSFIVKVPEGSHPRQTIYFNWYADAEI